MVAVSIDGLTHSKAAAKPSPLPSVDLLIRRPDLKEAVERFGRRAVVDAVRVVLNQLRVGQRTGDDLPVADQIAIEALARLDARNKSELRRVFNLTGTVLHTNLGRALLSEAAIEHAATAMRWPCNVEFDLKTGRRGERDSVVEELLIELTGAEAATVVNNNAAAVLLVLTALAHDREVVLSRGEMIEIGGAFRIPDVMVSAGARLTEVGTTNRTHPRDYADAIGIQTAALMKVHPSNFAITGYTAAVAEAELARIAHAHQLPLFVDMGAGSLIDLSVYGLPREPVVREVVATGADVVTFSGDKLLGGPQAGLIVGRKALIEQIRRHPLKRALRLSKLTLAALEATLLAYRTPDLLTRDLPTLRLLTRPLAAIKALAERVQTPLAAALGAAWRVEVTAVSSQVGSGSLPVDVIPSAALACTPATGKPGAALLQLAQNLRRLPVPVIGRISHDRLLLDLRCLEDEDGFVGQLPALTEAFK